MCEKFVLVQKIFLQILILFFHILLSTDMLILLEHIIIIHFHFEIDKIHIIPGINIIIYKPLFNFFIIPLFISMNSS